MFPETPRRDRETGLQPGQTRSYRALLPEILVRVPKVLEIKFLIFSYPIHGYSDWVIEGETSQ